MNDQRVMQLHSAAREQGMATLLFSLLLLLLATVVTLYTSDTIKREQKLTNNDQRSTAAFEAAEAGLVSALAYVADNPDRDDDDIYDPVFDTDSDQVGDSDSSAVGPASVTVATAVSAGQVTVEATGYSDDHSAVHVVSQIIAVVDPLPNDPAHPLTTKGSVVINGSATVDNPEGHSTIWGGGDVDIGSNNATSTMVPDSGDAGYPGCMDTPMTCETVSSSNKLSVGLDVIEHDSSLGNLSADELFENFFGMAPVAYHSSAMVTIDTVADDANDDAQLATHEVIWVEGDASFKNTTVGYASPVAGNAANGLCAKDPNDYSDSAKPSILIINGDATFEGSPNFIGLVFITGDIYVRGNMGVMGAVVVAGELYSDAGGSMHVCYNSDVLNDLENAGPHQFAAGTWKDF